MVTVWSRCDNSRYPLYFGRRGIERYSHNAHVVVNQAVVKQAEPPRKVRKNYLDKLCRVNLMRNYARAEMQGLVFERGDFARSLRQLMKQYVDSYLVKLIEDLFVFAYWFARSRSKMDTFMAIMTFFKLRVKDSALESIATESLEIIEMLEGQAHLQGFEDNLKDFRKLLDNWEDVKKSSLGIKYWNVIRHMIRFGLFEKLGIPNTKENHKEMHNITAFTLLEGADFAYCVVDCFTLTLQRALAWKRTGKWQTMIHGESSYQQWFDDCLELKRQYLMINDLELAGTNFFSFSSRLKDAIERGENMVEFANRTSADFRPMRMMLNDIKIMDLNLLSRKNAQETRPAPFAALVFGGSSVAKTTFTNLMFAAYANYRHLPQGEEYIYTRDSKQKHWTNFQSYKWGIRLDDVAYLQPGMAAGVDPTLDEFLSLLNNVPFVPEMAAVEEKGKCPVRSECVIATTNNKALSATDYFYCPFAIQRRVPWIITLTPKDEYAVDRFAEESARMLDPSKVPKIEDSYPDYWNIKIEKVVPGGKIGGGRQTGRHECVAQFNNINDFLDWYKKVVTEFAEIQAKTVLCNQKMYTFKICESCNRVKCTCQLQGAECLSLSSKGTNEQLSIVLEGNSIVKYYVNGIEADPCDAYGDFHSKAHSAGGEMYHTAVEVFEGEVKRRWVYPAEVKPVVREEKVDTSDMSELMRLTVREVTKKEPSIWKRIEMMFIGWGVRAYFTMPWVSNIAHSLLCFQFVRTFVIYQVGAVLEQKFGTRKAFAKMGQIMSHMYLSRRWRHAVTGLVALGGAVGVITIGVNWYKKDKKSEKAEEAKPVITQITYVPKKQVEQPAPGVDTGFVVVEGGKTKFTTELQAGSVNDDFFEKTEKENVWKKVDREITSFDVDPMQVNYAQLDTQQMYDTIRRNSRRMKAQGDKLMFGNAFCVGGHLFVTNNHLLPQGERVRISLWNSPQTDGVNENVEFEIDQDCIYRMPEKDLAFFECFPIPPLKDLRGLIAKPTFDVGCFRGAYVGYARDGSKLDMPVKGIHFVRDMLVHQLGQYINTWVGETDVDTEFGDCGLPLLVTGRQVVIAGLHQRRGGANVFCVQLNTDDVDGAVRHFKRPIIQGGVPKLNAEGANPKVFGEASHKSPLNWIQSGTARYFGHLQGWMSAPRSKVVRTLAYDTFATKRNWTCDFVKPVFGWKPYHNMYKDIFGMQYTFKTSVLQKAVSGLSQDLIKGMPAKSKRELKVISWDAALNGIDGVQYIDKMNFNSSMGFPWNKSKSHFLIADPEREDKKLMPDHVMQRAYDIEERYKRGICACPVFSGQLKDEPRKQKKVDEGNIRVFMGGPVDWCLVVRRYLLSFTKAMQENKILCEAAIGCVAQSLEWEQFREHLCQFGPHKIVAGDYGKFDKRMNAQVILAAFEVIANVLFDAGWDEEELRVVYSIAEDVAYPYATVASDVLQFSGTNPSGHPDTVVINSIVNALYMRYCYIMLNERHECVSFKENVALLTYGDDNVMGVSDNVPWFNHTAIQDVLARYGVVYTMADKESASVPYISIDEVSFLKRTWRWDPDMEAYLCPLEEASIRKMQMVCVESSTISREAQMIDQFIAATNEWFYYGQKKFIFERAFIMKTIQELGLQCEARLKPIPTYEMLAARFRAASKDVKLERFGGTVPPPAWLKAE